LPMIVMSMISVLVTLRRVVLATRFIELAHGARLRFAVAGSLCAFPSWEGQALLKTRSRSFYMGADRSALRRINALAPAIPAVEH
jgi:hypothetical protein